MKSKLFSFQENALTLLEDRVNDARLLLKANHNQQIISFSAPTGSGKTIIMTALIEAVMFGSERTSMDLDARFLWISDSPELNYQSRRKIEQTSDRIKVSAMETIDPNFDEKYFKAGRVYFLNTQKIGKDKLLTSKGDNRLYTIWDTIRNTIEDFPDHFYLIIDEAHKGTKNDKEAREAMSIMQKLILGSKENDLGPVPIVIGMTATPQRFNELVGLTTATIHRCPVSPADVRSSGLLKDKVLVNYPEDINAYRVMSMLQAAASDWKNKINHWDAYLFSQKEPSFNPILVIQVEDEADGSVSATNLSECLRTIEEGSSITLRSEEVAHTFNDYGDIHANGITISHIDPSRIQETSSIRVVFFKMNLSTGWDCPRAETMMSFRRATDATYIAQLLGRMIRTPLARRVDWDDELNTVSLFLPFFNEKTVDDVIKELRDESGGDVATEVIPKGSTEPLTATKHTFTKKKILSPLTPTNVNNDQHNGQAEFKKNDSSLPEDDVKKQDHPNNNWLTKTDVSSTDKHNTNTSTQSGSAETQSVVSKPILEKTPTNVTMTEVDVEIDGDKIIEAINNMSIVTYAVSQGKRTHPIKSLFRLASLLTNSGIGSGTMDEAKETLVDNIYSKITALKDSGEYNTKYKNIKNFRIDTAVIDTFGNDYKQEAKKSKNVETSDIDIEKEFDQAEKILFSEGLSQRYLQKYCLSDPEEGMMDIIIFVKDANCLNFLENKADDLFVDMYNRFTHSMKKAPEKVRTEYNEIGYLGATISQRTFMLPKSFNYPKSPGGNKYATHLYVNEDGYATIKLNTWEDAVVLEEEKRDDFVCWIRNPVRAYWSIAFPCKSGISYYATYPDILIVRKHGFEDFVMDVLEPHDPTRRDNIEKAHAFAEYAGDFPGVFGRLQLIRQVKGVDGKFHLKRLDLTDLAVRTKVLKASTNDELDTIFDSNGFFDENN